MGPKPTKEELKLMGNVEKGVYKKIEIKNYSAIKWKYEKKSVKKRVIHHLKKERK